MSTKFFNNNDNNNLYNHLIRKAAGLKDDYTFHAVVGYFRSSGYFKLRKELKRVTEIQILVGINIDNIFRNHDKNTVFLADETQAKEVYTDDFVDDVKNAKYSSEVETGILQMIDDLKSGVLKIKIHPTKNLHAKFYLLYSEDHDDNEGHVSGWAIMGSSNLSESGLGISQAPRYELNVALNDYDDVTYCKEQFDELWDEGIDICEQDMVSNIKKTHLGETPPTPYELYIKVLIDSFGSQVEDEFSMDLPDGFMDIQYQRDAAIQGYQMLLEHNGFILADVVGLGKTVVACMIAKRFVNANGQNTNILVVHPPALKGNWEETTKLFGLKNKVQLVSNGALDKVLDGIYSYREVEDYDMVIVDEAHGFRSNTSNKYDMLQQICKAPRANDGFVSGYDKKIMLLSATPLNNRPDDIKNLLLLFQNSNQCTIEGVKNLEAFFKPITDEYNELMKGRASLRDTSSIDQIYKTIRTSILDKVVVRRTRNNIQNNTGYSEDLKKQGIFFPTIHPPKPLKYELDNSLACLFSDTLYLLKEKLHYARYRAIQYLDDEEYLSNLSTDAKHISDNLASIYRVLMVKRLESSFYAFKKSLRSLLTITQGMIRMFEENKVLIAPDMNVKKLQNKGWDIEQIIDHIISKGYEESEFVFGESNFQPTLKRLLLEDEKNLKDFIERWDKIDYDPKLDCFLQELDSTFLCVDNNPTGKLVIFSESVDTVDYLKKQIIKRLHRNDVLGVSSANRSKKFERIVANFDANFKEQVDDYNILITSDVLAEGVNLHRANVIINYDSPWNATRLMQRIGRVNRIGSKAKAIHNYMFYPSEEGNNEIQLYQNALIKMQGFHSAFGEDAQIYSVEEIVREFQLFNPDIKDSVDKTLELVEEVRKLYDTEPDYYETIKNLPMKSRAARELHENECRNKTTVVFMSSPRKKEYYLVTNDTLKQIPFLEAVDYLRAERSEDGLSIKSVENFHYSHVHSAMNKFSLDLRNQESTSLLFKDQHNKKVTAVLNFLSVTCKEIFGMASDEVKNAQILKGYVHEGRYTQLTASLRKMNKMYGGKKKLSVAKVEELSRLLQDKVNTYHTKSRLREQAKAQDLEPRIVVSESFIQK